MRHALAIGLLLTSPFVVLSGLSGARAQGDDLEKRASWSSPTTQQLKTQLDKWISSKKLDDLTKLKVETLWPEEGGPATASELLEQLCTTFALVDDRAKQVVTYCRRDINDGDVSKFDFLTVATEKSATEKSTDEAADSENKGDSKGDKKADPKTAKGATPKDAAPKVADKTEVAKDAMDPWVRDNLRLYYGQWLAQNRLYDEALELLEGLQPQSVADPAALLFYQSAGYHRMLDKKKCLPVLDKLLENKDTIPQRYASVAKLMQADLAPLKTDSLDEIARLMSEINRRLDLGRAGTRVRKQEDDVIAKLDKLIEEMEKQQGGGGGTGPGGIQSSKPADDSMPLGGTGPGNVDPKNTGKAANWGNLPPKQRQEALQQISKELPAHFREVIEEYFKKLARDLGD